MKTKMVRKYLHGLGMTLILLAPLSGWSAEPVAKVLDGVRYDTVGVISSMDSGSVTINGQKYALSQQLTVRGGTKRSVVSSGSVQPGQYVGVNLVPTPRGTVVSNITILPL